MEPTQMTAYPKENKAGMPHLPLKGNFLDADIFGLSSI
jgi:hypothetical protein